jgi:hypothetical protein
MSPPGRLVSIGGLAELRVVVTSVSDVRRLNPRTPDGLMRRRAPSRTLTHTSHLGTEPSAGAARRTSP